MPRNIKNIKGQRFNKLLVSQATDIRSGTSVVWKCICDCGKELYVSSLNLQNGNTKSCGCLHKKDLSHQKFGLLTVIKPTDLRINERVIWLCKCDCGKYKNISSKNLLNDNTKSCGCSQYSSLPNNQSAKNKLHTAYIYNAKKRNIKWDLTKKHFINLTNLPCYLCGSVPLLKVTYGPSIYIYNGIDRIDNNIGYTIENSRPCCWTCNRMKLDSSLEEFRNHCRKIYQHEKTNSANIER